MFPKPYPEPEAEHGSVVYRCVFSRWFALFGAVLGAFFFFGSLYMLLLDWWTDSQGFDWIQIGSLIFALMIGGLVMLGFGSNVIRPSALVTVTDRGLLFHHDGVEWSREPKVFVPWDRVLGFEHKKYHQGGRRFQLIEVGVRWDESFPPLQFDPPYQSRSMSMDDPMSFDALAPSPSPKQLLAIMRDFHTRYGSGATVESTEPS